MLSFVTTVYAGGPPTPEPLFDPYMLGIGLAVGGVVILAVIFIIKRMRQ